MKAANGVWHSSAARPSEIPSMKFQRQQSSCLLREATLLQIRHPQKFRAQLYIHSFHSSKLSRTRQFSCVIACPSLSPPVNWSQLPAARLITLVPKSPHCALLLDAWASTPRPAE